MVLSMRQGCQHHRELLHEVPDPIRKPAGRSLEGRDLDARALRGPPSFGVMAIMLLWAWRILARPAIQGSVPARQAAHSNTAGPVK